jgi:hypothetical protein
MDGPVLQFTETNSKTSVIGFWMSSRQENPQSWLLPTWPVVALVWYLRSFPLPLPSDALTFFVVRTVALLSMTARTIACLAFLPVSVGFRPWKLVNLECSEVFSFSGPRPWMIRVDSPMICGSRGCVDCSERCTSEFQTAHRTLQWCKWGLKDVESEMQENKRLAQKRREITARAIQTNLRC